MCKLQEKRLKFVFLCSYTSLAITSVWSVDKQVTISPTFYEQLLCQNPFNVGEIDTRSPVAKKNNCFSHTWRHNRNHKDTQHCRAQHCETQHNESQQSDPSIMKIRKSGTRYVEELTLVFQHEKGAHPILLLNIVYCDCQSSLSC